MRQEAAAPARPIRQRLRRRLTEWYAHHRRDLPWRRTRDPYAIWVSEIMLQQTRAEAVRPYYERFLSRFPTPHALARAPLDDVLTLWAGLGYYSRARNLHRAAETVSSRYQGKLPSTVEELLALPGIGRYTAGAIASIAFGRAAPLVDGNVARVLARLFLAADRRAAWQLAAQLVPRAPGAAAVFNQALMELGATVCTPRRPACELCPLAADCLARQHGIEQQVPSPRRSRAIRVIDATVLVLARRAQLLLVQRPPRGLWGGLWEFPTATAAAARSLGPARLPTSLEHLVDGAPHARGMVEHTLTHRHMRFHVFTAVAQPGRRAMVSGYQAARWVSPQAVRRLAVSSATLKILDLCAPWLNRCADH